MLRKSYFAAIVALFVVTLSGSAVAQKPRTVADDPNQPATPPAPAPPIVKAKYEGGVFGYTKKKEGTLTIDADNSQLIFKDDKGKRWFHIPFGAITGAYGDTHSVQPAAATVASHIPYGSLAGLIKTKVRYLTIQYDDPDSAAAGVTSFRLENQQILDSVLYSVATKAGLTRRGEVYIRKKI
jgi:hypothetical protein